MTVVFGLRQRLRMRTRLDNGVLRNGQQHGSAVNTFTDQGKLKKLSGRRAPRCGRHQFRAKITVSTCNVFKLSLFERNEEEKWYFHYRTPLRLAVFRGAFRQLYESSRS